VTTPQGLIYAGDNMSEDILDDLKAERDRCAKLRQRAFANDEIIEANDYDATCVRLFRAITEIEQSRAVIATMKDVMMQRIIETAIKERLK